MLFNQKNIALYVFALSLVAVASYVATKFKSPFEEGKDEYALIKKYLLNDSPLHGYSRPKIWIHTKFEYNSRIWASFQDRSSTNLNQPYLHLTIKSILDQCSDDFHICLIDDDSFSKLIPSWDVDFAYVAEPMKSWIRTIGLAELVYYYGGMVVPNSFLCFESLKETFRYATSNDRPFVCESVNRNVNLAKQGDRRLAFLPSTYFMGANKNDPVLLDLVKFMKTRVQMPHFSGDRNFLGEVEYWCLDKIDEGAMNLLGGDIVGVKTAKKKPVLLDNLMEEEYLPLTEHCVGIYIPSEEILERTKYQWFAIMSTRDILDANFILSKYMKVAMVNGARDHLPKKVRKAIAI